MQQDVCVLFFPLLPCFLSGFLSFPFVCYYQCGTTTVAHCSDTQLEINHFSCRRKPPLFFSLSLFVFVCFFLSFHRTLSGAAVRASVKVHQVPAPSPPLHTHSLLPLISISPPLPSSLQLTVAALVSPSLPTPSGPPCALSLPPSSPPLLSCQTNLQLLLLTSTFPVKVLLPTHTHARSFSPSRILQLQMPALHCRTVPFSLNRSWGD